YISYGKEAQQACWVHNFLLEIGDAPSRLYHLTPTQITRVSLQSWKTLSFTNSLSISIYLQYHYLWNIVEQREIKIHYVSSEENI
ncbi:hypothetical protein FB446DRAFT_654049, partial [Lentinula raphanica]